MYTFGHAYDVAIMLLGCSPFPFIYSDIKNNYVNHLFLKQYIKVKDKCLEKDENYIKIATMHFYDNNCFKEIPSFEIIDHVYNDQLANKNEVQSNNESTESIVDFNEKDQKKNLMELLQWKKKKSRIQIRKINLKKRIQQSNSSSIKRAKKKDIILDQLIIVL